MAKLLKRYTRHYLPLFLFCVVLMSARVACELAIPYLMGDMVDAGVAQGDTAYIAWAGGWMLLFAAGAMGADIANAGWSAKVSMGLSRDIRADVYDKVTSFGRLEMRRFGTASLITRTTNDVQQVERFTHMCMTIALASPVKIAGSIIASWATSRELAVIVLATTPVVVALVVAVMRWAMPWLRSLQQRIDDVNRVAREGLTGVRTIRAFRRERYEERRFAKANRDLAEANVAAARRTQLISPLITFVLNMAIVVMVWAGAFAVQGSSLQVGDLMATVQYMAQVTVSVIMLSVVFLVWPRASAAAERVEEVLSTKPEVTDPAPDAAADVSAKRRATAHRLSFEDVTFGFPGAEKPVVEHVDLTLEPGGVYALVGSTGSGKSTLADLAMRFHDPTSGRVTIDGVDLRDLRQDDLHQMVAHVAQRPRLFTGTIASNIRLGDARATDDEVRRAAAAAQVLEFAEHKAEGLETRVAQSATGLSGGQRQRVAIARAYLRRAGLYVLDDAGSALDAKTQAELLDGLRKAVCGATVLMVVSRVEAARAADQIVVLERGRIDSVGTHEQLMETSAVYRQIVASQALKDMDIER